MPKKTTAPAPEKRVTNARAAITTRRARAVESFKTAGDCIGPLFPGIAVFAVTRGQFSMIDAVMACLEQTGPAKISLWTWTVAEYEVECMERLRQDQRVTDGLLVIDGGARAKNAGLIRQWQGSYGPESVRYVHNHSKIATIEGGGYRLLLRGSMNLNFNPRFEQFDLTEGGPDFDLVREIEADLPFLPNTCSGADVYAASRTSAAFTPEQLSVFKETKTWAPTSRPK